MEIRIPEVGESVFEALVAKWHRQNGELVAKDEPVCEIETDKITLELNAEADGVLTITVEEGTTVKIGTVIGAISPKAQAATGESEIPPGGGNPPEGRPLSPAVRKLSRESGINPAELKGSGRGGRVVMDDLFSSLQSREHDAGTGTPSQQETSQSVVPEAVPVVRSEESEEYRVAPAVEQRTTRQRMSPIRKRIAERLLLARQQTAMLTTFNEADLGRLIALKNNHKDHFLLRHGVPLGFMSFFVKACVDALKEFPAVNARIEGDDIVFQHFYDIGIAIGGDKGLVVPVIRNADRLTLAEIEQGIKGFVERIKGNQLNLSDLAGGTFTISNGGVYGSLLSTPIMNPPQSGVLGMHAIQERPVALNGKVVIRPMMYLALSYDHRIIDGREAVSFLKRIKEDIEDPEEMLLEG
jgi:2-oxoglutarate dehydrogenase E2 component (dihydrolipoamide succinyltransferase)